MPISDERGRRPKKEKKKRLQGDLSEHRIWGSLTGSTIFSLLFGYFPE